MSDEILDYISEVSSSTETGALLSVITKRLENYGFNKFSYLGFNAKAADRDSSGRPGFYNSTFVQSTYPDAWVKHYYENDFVYCDPIITFAKTNLLPCRWNGGDFVKQVPPSQQKVLKEGREFGIKRGVVIPVHAPGGEFGSVAFATDESELNLDAVWKHKRHELHLMGIYYHAAIWENVFKRNIEPTPGLTPRELQCLEWAGRGKTVWEISKILGISEATAKTHLRAAIAKMDTTNKTHAVSKALLHGLITV